VTPILASVYKMFAMTKKKNYTLELVCVEQLFIREQLFMSDSCLCRTVAHSRTVVVS